MDTQNGAYTEPAYDNPAERVPPPLNGPEPTRRTAPPAMPAAAATAPRRDFFDDPRRKSPVLALVLSLMPGLGQCYVGYYNQGFVNMLVVGTTIAMLSSNVLHHLEPLFGIFLAFFWLFNLVDAWRRAVFYNNALAGIGPATLPDDFSVTKIKGSLGAGVGLVVVGGVLLSNTLFGMSLEWLEKWWPVGLIAVGVWLIYPTFTAKKDETVG